MTTTRAPRALLLRSTEFASTPALPRFGAVLAELLGPGRTHALCWRTNPRFHTPVDPACGVSVVHYERAADSRSFLAAAVALLLWWARIIRELWRGRFTLVQASDVFSLVAVILVRPWLRYRVVADIRDHIGSISATHWGYKARFLGWLEAFLIRRADAVIVVDETRKELLPPDVVARGNVIVVRNLPINDAGPAPVELGPDLHVNFSGFLTRIRGAGMLLDAVERVPGAWLDVVGETNEEALARRLFGSPRVKSHGRVSHPEAMRRMGAADLVALLYDPSITANRYAAPNKFYEAMMLGRPALVTEGTPMAEWVAAADCGYVVAYGDVAGLAAVLEDIRSDRAGWRRRCANARNLFERELRWPSEASRLRDAYQRLAAVPVSVEAPGASSENSIATAPSAPSGKKSA